MRHGKKFNHLSSTAEHRKAMLANMACSLIEHKRINTTVAKAKALKRYVEPLITKSKSDTTHSRRTVFSYLKNKEAVTVLFRDVAVKVADRPGDAAEMCMIELVDYNDIYTTDKPEKKKRSRRGSSKKSDAAVATEEVAESTTEAVSTQEALQAENDAADAKEEKKDE